MDDTMAQGLTLMATGMGVVIAFLLILVAVMSALSALVLRFAPPRAKSAPAAGGGLTANPPPPAIVAAIQDAIRQHRTQERP